MVEAILTIECEGASEEDLEASLERIEDAFEEFGEETDEELPD
jgi:hypothetical protein